MKKNMCSNPKNNIQSKINSFISTASLFIWNIFVLKYKKKQFNENNVICRTIKVQPKNVVSSVYLVSVWLLSGGMVYSHSEGEGFNSSFVPIPNPSYQWVLGFKHLIPIWLGVKAKCWLRTWDWSTSVRQNSCLWLSLCIFFFRPEQSENFEFYCTKNKPEYDGRIDQQVGCKMAQASVTLKVNVSYHLEVPLPPVDDDRSCKMIPSVTAHDFRAPTSPF